MSHQRLLTSAAWPRHGTPPIARRLPLCLLVFLSLAAGAPFAAAEMVYYTEDFCNDGEPGFDPMFNHELDCLSGHDPETCWNLWSTASGDCWFGLHGAADMITFNLAEGERVVYASVEAPLNYFSPKHGYVGFIGDEGVWQTSQSDYGTYFFDITSAEIGEIQSIVLCGEQTVFTTIRIGVIPEPGAGIIIFGGVVAALAARRRFPRSA